MNTNYYTLEFDKIKNQLADFCINESAKANALALEPEMSELTLKKLKLDTDNARKIIDVCGTPPLPNVENAKALINKIEKDGLLYPDELSRFCTTQRTTAKKSGKTKPLIRAVSTPKALISATA